MEIKKIDDKALEEVAGGFEGMERELAPGVIQFVRRKVHQLKAAGYNRTGIGVELYKYIDEMSDVNNAYFGNEFGGRIDYQWINILIDEEMETPYVSSGKPTSTIR